MKPLFSLLLVWLMSGLLPASAADEVFVIPVQTAISRQQSLFLRRAVKEAERSRASAVVLDMDTPGGEGFAAMAEIKTMQKTKLPTYTYVNDKALSAGALIALSTQRIYMAPGGVIGAAAVVTGEGRDLETTMKEKVTSAMSSVAREAATRSGHNPDVADAFIRKESQLKIGDTVIDGPDTLLTLNASEATRKFQNKPVLAEGTADSLEDMLKMAGLSNNVRRVEPTGFESLSIWLTELAPLLLLIATTCAYIEFKTPGFGVAGIASIIAFTLFFASSYIAGLAGWEAWVLFAIGVLFILSELFVHPGTIFPGVIGIVLMLSSIIWAMIDRFPGDPIIPTQAMLMRPLLNLALAMVGSAVAIYFLARYLPKTRLYQSIVLSETLPQAVLGEAEEAHVLPGAAGKARTTLRPSGKAEFNGLVFDVVSRGEYIPSGQEVRVVAVQGPRVVVEPV